jgi:hypothetical protein
LADAGEFELILSLFDGNAARLGNLSAMLKHQDIRDFRIDFFNAGLRNQ